jgi:hypothetical protein
MILLEEQVRFVFVCFKLGYFVLSQLISKKILIIWKITLKANNEKSLHFIKILKNYNYF